MDGYYIWIDSRISDLVRGFLCPAAAPSASDPTGAWDASSGYNTIIALKYSWIDNVEGDQINL